MLFWITVGAHVPPNRPWVMRQGRRWIYAQSVSEQLYSNHTHSLKCIDKHRRGVVTWCVHACTCAALVRIHLIWVQVNWVLGFSQMDSARLRDVFIMWICISSPKLWCVCAFNYEAFLANSSDKPTVRVSPLLFIALTLGARAHCHVRRPLIWGESLRYFQSMKK